MNATDEIVVLTTTDLDDGSAGFALWSYPSESQSPSPVYWDWTATEVTAGTE